MYKPWASKGQFTGLIHNFVIMTGTRGSLKEPQQTVAWAKRYLFITVLKPQMLQVRIYVKYNYSADKTTLSVHEVQHKFVK